MDVGSSSVARNVCGLAIGYSKAIVVDMGFCLQVIYVWFLYVYVLNIFFAVQIDHYLLICVVSTFVDILFWNEN